MVLGVTGGIASGKSTVAKMLQKLGALVLSADVLAREVVLPGSPVLESLRRHFGPQVIAADGTLAREVLAEIVFSQPQQRLELDKIMHPAIAILSQKRLSEARRLQQKNGGLVVYEAPLLYEAGAEDRVDKVLAVTVVEAVQLQRLQQRDHCDVATAHKRIAAHMPQEEKAQRADYVIDNSQGIVELQSKVAALYRQLVGDSVA
jgi:dephospho-CoA kinase